MGKNKTTPNEWLKWWGVPKHPLTYAYRADLVNNPAAIAATALRPPPLGVVGADADFGLSTLFASGFLTGCGLAGFGADTASGTEKLCLGQLATRKLSQGSLGDFSTSDSIHHIAGHLAID